MPDDNDRPHHGEEDVESVVAGEWNGRKARFWSRRIVLRLSSDGNPEPGDLLKLAEDIAGSVGGTARDRSGLDPDVAEILFPADVDVVAMARQVDARDDVVFAEPVFSVAASCPAGTGGSGYDPLGMVNVAEAWEVVRASSDPPGGEDVCIAVMDTGFPATTDKVKNHEDLQSGRFILATDTYNDTLSSPAYPDHRDQDGHGSEVTGVVAADHNSVGIDGVNGGSPVYSYRVMSSRLPGETTTTAVYDAVIDFLGVLTAAFAADGVVRRAVVNLSLGSATESDLFASMCQKTLDEYEKNGTKVMFCCAAGNEPTVESVQYPARYSLDATYGDIVIAVGAVDETGARLDRPDLGAVSVAGAGLTVMAPGWNVMTTAKTDDTATDEAGKPHATYTEAGLTSIATPFVTGLVSLMWSVNPCLTCAQVKRVIQDTAVPLAVDVVLPSDEWGYGLIDCKAAVQAVNWVIAVDTAGLEFVAAEGEPVTLNIELSVEAAMDIEFEATSVILDVGAEHAGAFDLGESVNHNGSAEASGSVSIPITYTGTAAGDVCAGFITVGYGTCEVTVTVTARTMPLPTSLLVLTLDRSGSMGEPSGIGSDTRMEVLQWSAKILIAMLEEGSGVGIVGFSDDASDELAALGYSRVIQIASDADRASLDGAVDGLAPGGRTSIGDGVLLAQDVLDSTGEYDNEAIVVFTDGRQNEPEMVEDVTVTGPVYAVAAGDVDVIEPSPLIELTGETDGYALLAEELDDESEYKLAKYFLQILADASGDTVVTDPTSVIPPGHRHRIPFHVTRDDVRTDIVLMMPASSLEEPLLDLMLETPSGDPISPDDVAAISGAEYVTAERVSFYRFRWPVIGERYPLGRWHAIVRLQRAKFKKHVNATGSDDLGVRYSLVVQGRSAVDMRCRSLVGRDGLTIRAVLTEGRVPLRPSPAVTAHVVFPDRSEADVDLREVAPSVFEYTYDGRLSGVFEFLVQAGGLTRRRERFTRERVVTAFIPRAAPPPRP